MKNIAQLTIMIDTINKVKSFNNIALHYEDTDLDLVSGRYRVDAKSLMGLFSLDLSRPVTLEFNSEYAETVEKLFEPFISE